METSSRITFTDFEHWIHEDVLLLDDPAVIKAEVSMLLSRLDCGNVFAVSRLAKEIDAEIAHELAIRDGDMVEVVRWHGDLLGPIMRWLECHGVNSRSLRRARR